MEVSLPTPFGDVGFVNSALYCRNLINLPVSLQERFKAVLFPYFDATFVSGGVANWQTFLIDNRGFCSSKCSSYSF